MPDAEGPRLFYTVIVGEMRTSPSEAGHSLGSTYLPQADCHVRIFYAADRDAAYERALQVGEWLQTEAIAEGSWPVGWRFVGLAELDTVHMEFIQGSGASLYAWTADQSAHEMILGREQLSCFAADSPDSA